MKFVKYGSIDTLGDTENYIDTFKLRKLNELRENYVFSGCLA